MKQKSITYSVLLIFSILIISLFVWTANAVENTENKVKNTDNVIEDTNNTNGSTIGDTITNTIDNNLRGCLKIQINSTIG